MDCRRYDFILFQNTGNLRRSVTVPGIVRCADCGEKLYYCTSKNFEARQDHFVCSTSRLKGKEVCPTHFIRAVVLEQGVLAHMRLI